MIYRSKKELIETYKVEASFYDYNFKDIGKIKCRNIADIIRKGYEDSAIDSYIIMMNPGSCKVIDNKISVINTIKDIPIQLKEAKSDPAQVCIMRLMDNLELNKVRILNLSDIAEPKSGIALSVMNKLEENNNMTSSIFSKERRKELDKITEQSAIYILSWGVSNRLNNYKKLALDFVKDKKTIGIKKDNNDFLYYYIKPIIKDSQNRIIEEITNEFKAIS